MIARDVAQLQVVPAFRHNAQFMMCETGVVAGTCTCAGGVTAAGVANWFPGFIIDRLGLQQSFNSLAIAPNAWADLRVSDENAHFYHYAIGIGLQHTCTTGGTFADYSTGGWIDSEPLWRQTTATATACAMYTAVQRDASDSLGGMTLTTATSTASGVSATVGSTSTGYAYYAGPAAIFDLTAAKRYIRAVVKPIMNSTACGSGFIDLSATMLFGEPQVNPQQYPDPVKRILVTTGCAT